MESVSRKIGSVVEIDTHKDRISHEVFNQVWGVCVLPNQVDGMGERIKNEISL